MLSILIPRYRPHAHFPLSPCTDENMKTLLKDLIGFVSCEQVIFENEVSA